MVLTVENPLEHDSAVCLWHTQGGKKAMKDSSAAFRRLPPFNIW